MKQTSAVQNDIANIADQATDLLKSFSSQKLEAAKEYSEMTRGYVRSNPWAALGIAAAAGLVIGILVSRR